MARSAAAGGSAAEVGDRDDGGEEGGGGCWGEVSRLRSCFLDGRSGGLAEAAVGGSFRLERVSGAPSI